MWIDTNTTKKAAKSGFMDVLRLFQPFLVVFIRCDWIIIAHFVYFTAPSVKPACNRLLLVMPTWPSVKVSNMAEILPK